MTEQSKFRVCQDRCPADYGFPDIHEKIVEKIEQDPHKVYKAAGCLGVCTRLGGVDNRPVGGIGNFEEITSDDVRLGLFALNESNKITRVYLDEIL
jgi:hypothetical protein